MELTERDKMVAIRPLVPSHDGDIEIVAQYVDVQVDNDLDSLRCRVCGAKIVCRKGTKKENLLCSNHIDVGDPDVCQPGSNRI